MSVLFECDFSRDELAVLADLLELDALPGLDPRLPVPEPAKAAAARGLLARAVLVADGAAGTVEITQPYATMLSLVLHATRAEAGEPSAPGDVDVVYRGGVADVRITADAGPLVRWAVQELGGEAPAAAVVAERDADGARFGSS